MEEIITLDVRGMSCSQSNFQVKKIIINNIDNNTKIEVLTNEASNAENIIRGCSKYGYTGEYTYNKDNEIIVKLIKS